jgi:chloramphenicol-sensitive protein RarD
LALSSIVVGVDGCLLVVVFLEQIVPFKRRARVVTTPDNLPGGPPLPKAGAAKEDARAGAWAALGAYGVWGLFPLMFRLLDGVSPPTIVAHRVIWSLVVVGGILKVQGRMGEVEAALKDRRTLTIIAFSAALLALNWLVFIWAVEVNRVLDVSLGYFINPLVNVVLGMVFLGEKQNHWQWLAISIAVLAMFFQSITLGAFPLVALTLAFSFGGYGYLRKTVAVGSAPGLFIEALLMLPVALAYMGYTIVVFGPGVQADPLKLTYLVLTGPATAGALLMFAFAARRMRLTTLGMFQYIAPSMHFIIAVWLFGEPLNNVQILSFVLIWVSLGIYSFDSVRTQKKQGAQGI